MSRTKLSPKKRFHNLREMLDFSCTKYAHKPAFYEKSGVKFRPTTYLKLRSDIRSLGAALTHRGLLGKKIILLGDNSYQWSLAYLTALCGLGIIIPVDKEIPESDLCEIAKISGAAAIIFSSKYQSKADALPKKLQKISFEELLVLCEHGMSSSDRELHDFNSISIDTDAVAAIIFTKESAGSSKGIMLSHRNFCAAIEGLSLSLPTESDGLTLALLPLHSAYESVSGLLFPLSRGNAIAFTENIKNALLNAKELSPTSIICSPFIIERIHKKIWANIRRRKIDEKVTNLIRATDSIKLPSLKDSAKKKLFADIHASFGGRIKFIMVGGSLADNEAIMGMRAFGFNVVSAYGLTECTALAAITPTDPINKKAVGTALPIGELKIVEPDSNGVGEICYRGDNVMLGYYKQDELNREIKQNGWIRTGDLGTVDQNGYLTVLGRKKNVICSSGKKVYPEELEILLFRSPYVQECAVIGIKNEERAANDIVAVIYPNLTYAKEVLGLYASRPMIKEKISTLIAEINTRLPQYKQISYFVLLDEEIPKNAYKKIERSTLPEFITREYLAFED